MQQAQMKQEQAQPEPVLTEEVGHTKASSNATIRCLAVVLLKNLTDGEGLAGLVKDILVDLANDARYVFDKNMDDVHSSGDIGSARAIADAGEAVRNVLNSSFAGACVAKLLVCHPLVESFTLELTSSHDRDDSGNNITSRDVNVVDLAFLKGVQSVTMEDFGGNEFDPQRYADHILDIIRDQGVEQDVHCGFAGTDEHTEDIDVKVSRTDLKHLLGADMIDGLAVAKIILATAQVV